MSYSFWNNFVHDWVYHPNTYSPQVWNSLPNDNSFDYVPEPWWGNDGTQLLYSVCINLNPGRAEAIQKRTNVQKVFTDYAGFVNSSFLKKTEEWHRNRRAKAIGSALNSVEGSLPMGQSAGALANHLSVELIPWHTEHAESKYGIWNYIKHNLQPIFFNSLLFAANESTRVIGKLNNTVILRFSASTAEKIFKMLVRGKIISGFGRKDILLSNENVKCAIFHLEPIPAGGCYGLDISTISFIAIWRKHSKNANDFPAKDDMIEIIRSL